MLMQYALNKKAEKLGIEFRAPDGDDAGWDIMSCDETVLYPGERMLVGTGLHMALPNDTVGILKDRSGMASKGIHVLGGVIDCSYRGEVKVILLNVGHSDYYIHHKDRIAQMIILPVLHRSAIGIGLHKSMNIETLSKTARGDGGFGSTGR